MDKNSLIRLQLSNILKLQNVNHKIEIMKQATIKDAHVYCKINSLSGQLSGPLIEYYIKNKYDMIKNNASMCIGDLRHRDSNIEIKVSNGGKSNNKFNYVQIRMNHLCNYIFTAYYIDYENLDNLGELFIFKLTKNDLIPIILKYGSYAHGTISKLGIITIEELCNIKNDKEYSIRPKYGDECWKMLLQYRVDEHNI